MNHNNVFLTMFIPAIFGVAQAGALEIYHPSTAIDFFDDQPLAATGTLGNSSCSSFLSDSTGGLYSWNDYGPAFGPGHASVGASTDLDTPPPTSIGENAFGAGFSGSGGSGHSFKAGDRQRSHIGYAILNSQTNLNGVPVQTLNVSDSYANNVDYDVARAAPAPASEPQAWASELQTYAMLLAGIGLFVLAAFRRRSGPFD